MISIIIPYFDRIDNVRRAIISVFAQTYSNWELFLINDCSTEDNQLVLDICQGPNGQLICHYKNTVNNGPGYSRNIGIKESRGEYLVFLDSDDLLMPNFLERMLDKMDKDLLFVYCSAKWSDGTFYKSSNKPYNSALPTLLAEGRPWPTVSILWNKLNLPYFDEELRAWEDYLFEFTAALSNNKIRHVNEALVTIGEVDKFSLSSNSGTALGWLNNLKAIDRMLIQLELNGFWKNISLVKLLLISYAHFFIRLKRAEKKSSLEFKSKTLRIFPKNILTIRIIRRCLRKI